jgi:hypothetical protein
VEGRPGEGPGLFLMQRAERLRTAEGAVAGDDLNLEMGREPG